MGWITGWDHREKLSLNFNRFDDTQTNFETRVHLDDSNFDFSKAQLDGRDIRFTSDDGATLLKFDRDVHDSVNEIAEYFVKIPSIPGATDLTIPGEAPAKAFADSENGANVAANAFDHSGIWESTDTVFPHYIGWDFGVGNAQIFNSYTIQNRDSDSPSRNAPYDWKLQGSQTGAWSGEEVDLDIRVNVILVRREKKVFDNFSEGENTTAYRYYRLYITDNQPNATNNIAMVSDITFLTGTNTDFYMYYGSNTAIDDSDPENVWSRYNAVWHLKEQTNGTSDEVKDSTSSNHDGTGSGFPDLVDAVIYKGQQGGTDKYISVPDSPDFDFNAGEFSIEFKFKFSGTLGTTAFMGHSDGQGSGNNKWILGYELDTSNRVQFHIQPGDIYVNFHMRYSWVFVPDTNYHCVVQRDGARWDLFVNGARVDFESPGAVTVGDSSNFLALLTDGENSNWQDSILDEVRIIKGSSQSISRLWSLAFSDANDVLSFGAQEGESETLYISERSVIGPDVQVIFNTDLRSLVGKFFKYASNLVTSLLTFTKYNTDLHTKADSKNIFSTDLRVR